MKSELLMLAHTYQPHKNMIAGFFVSEKLDGQRAFWDGGVTRGMFADEVPWCYSEKHDRYVDRKLSTGLWSRYGQPIQAEDWWIDKLPVGLMLDGELWKGRGSFQEVSKVTRSHHGDWKGMEYMIFDSPPVEKIFRSRIIDNPSMKKEIVYSGCLAYVRDCAMQKAWDASVWACLCNKTLDFRDIVKLLPGLVAGNDVIRVLEQKKLPVGIRDSLTILDAELEYVEKMGGEGLMLRRPVSQWIPERSHDLLKVKTFADLEVEVVGYTWGEETDRGSKLLGMMGAAVCKMPSGFRFKLSGFTEAERKMGAVEGMYENTGVPIEEVVWGVGRLNPGGNVPDWIQNPMFPRGAKITVKYRELTDGGIPKEARYWRKA